MNIRELKSFARQRGFSARQVGQWIQISDGSIEFICKTPGLAAHTITRFYVESLKKRIEKGEHIRISLEDEFFRRLKRQQSEP